VNWEGGEFARQRLANWCDALRVSQVELAHVPETTNRKAVSELAGQPRSQIIQKFLAILCTLRSLLFLLNNSAANLVVRIDL
jgi:hypothetical protein